MEDNQIYSIQLLENEGITPSMGGGKIKLIAQQNGNS